MGMELGIDDSRTTTSMVYMYMCTTAVRIGNGSKNENGSAKDVL